MTFAADIKASLKPRCPVCQRGKLFKPWSVTVVDNCSECGEKLSDHDIGDGAAVFMIFIFGFTIVPLAWLFEILWSPPMWGQALIWTCVMLAILAVVLPAIKCYIIMLEYRHLKTRKD